MVAAGTEMLKAGRSERAAQPSSRDRMTARPPTADSGRAWRVGGASNVIAPRAHIFLIFKDKALVSASWNKRLQPHRRLRSPTIWR
jgi:hypothetical protein